MDYAFLVHSRGREDLRKRFKILRLLPNPIFDLLTLTYPPFVVAKITGPKNKNGEDISGATIGIPMTAAQLLANRELASKRIIQATKLAKRLGAKVVGLGAMTASLSKGGVDILEKVPEMRVVTGRTYTSANVASYVDFFCDKIDLNRNLVQIGIVGAAGSIGTGVAQILASRGYKKILLLDLERKRTGLEECAKLLRDIKADISLTFSSDLDSLRGCDFVVTATSAAGTLVEKRHLQPGTIVINDAQPSDVSDEVLKDENFLVVEGGLVEAPGIKTSFRFGLSGKNLTFSCLAEVLLLCFDKQNDFFRKNDSAVRGLDFTLLEYLKKNAKLLGFKPASPQNFIKVIRDGEAERTVRLLEERREITI